VQPRHLSSAVDEHYFINESLSQMKTVMMMKSFPSNISVTVISSAMYDSKQASAINKAWASSYKDIVTRLPPGTTHSVVNGADHRLVHQNPEAIIEPIKKLVKKWRRKMNLA